jgi:hypothetical protein
LPLSAPAAFTETSVVVALARSRRYTSRVSFGPRSDARLSNAIFVPSGLNATDPLVTTPPVSAFPASVPAALALNSSLRHG